MRPIGKAGYIQGNSPAGPSEVGSAGDAVETPVPQVKASHVRALIGVLRTQTEWTTRKTLAMLLGKPTPSFERVVRATASVAAPQVVSFPGSPGYKLFAACTVEEIEHCINALRAQATDMNKRANLYQHALNARLSNAAPVVIQDTFALDA